ncbi:MAG: endolytic transglycosylase MltG [Candidatus Peregrinibacteria bacterium]|nr:endolytic transglycosylase MltG [Candidatus Peregrinibacteria bacterium]
MARRRNGLGTYILMVAVASVVLIGLKSIVGGGSWADTPYDSEDPSEINFDIESGATGRSIAENLDDQGLISSSWRFYWYLKSNDLGGNLQAGRFTLSPSMTPAEIADALTTGSGELTVTILEGWTIEQIDDYLYGLGLIEDDGFTYCTENCPFEDDWDFLEGSSSLEGYMFPDTYFVDPASFTSEGFIHTLLLTFETRFLTEENQTAINSSGRTLDEIIIMGSIVEKESLWDEDYALIAGIFWKRYDNDWGLGSDVTLLYVLDGPEELDYNLDLESAYNTRKYRGLPPTAISNPSLFSLEAALYPEDSDYWYFLADPETGKAYYATTNDEHNANKAKYLY